MRPAATLSPVSACITIVTTGRGDSIASGDPERMNPEPDTVAPEPPPGGGGGGGWARPVALVASCLVIGFVGGWVFRGDDGQVTVLPPSASADAGGTGSVTTGGATTAPSAGTTTTAPAPPVAPPDRADIALTVLNGTNENGLAGRIAAQAESLGYAGVTTGNAPTSSSPSIAYFAPGQRPAAQRVAKDLEVDGVQALPTTGALADAAPDGIDVALVLGPG